MSLTNALFSSVSGLETASTQISVIGDNIANANTTGFKEKRAEFSAVLGQNITAGAGFAQVGAGARVSDIGAIFSQGVFERTARGTDLGIEGQGFFVLEGQSGISYSRSGLFGFDSSGTLVDTIGNRVQGYGIDDTTGASNGVLGDITINQQLTAPQATSTIDVSVNLDAEAADNLGPFDPANPEGTSNESQVVRIYDSLGTGRLATVYFTKDSAGTWDYNVTLGARDSSVATTDPVVVQGSGQLVFDGDGALTTGSTPSGTFTFGIDGSGGATTSQPITFTLGSLTGAPGVENSTQFSQAYVTNSVGQDGFTSGTLESLDIDSDGLVNGVFSNGVTASLAQLSLANFVAVEGLQDVGGSRLIESVASGAPIIAAAGSGSLGSIRSNALEKSNVDLAQQFVNLIVSQRAFQANTRTASVANELLANLVSLGQ
ncbi:MAG: flagellar hook protein FlgE [Myxococcota bacterium]